MTIDTIGINNKLIKDLSKLKVKKFRDFVDLILIEGKRFINEAIVRNVRIKYIFATDESLFPNIEAEKYLIGNTVLRELTNTSTPSGIVAVVELKRNAFVAPTGKFLVLDHIQDPGNLGALIRTALAFNYNFIYCYNCVDYRNDKVLRSSMGTIFDVTIMDVKLEHIQELARSFNLICADMHESNAKIGDGFGLVLGNEANGVCDEIKALCSGFASIPMENNVESLNVAVAGGILMSKL